MPKSQMQAAVPSAGTRVLALLISEATSLEHPNQKATHQRTSLVYHWESASDQDQDNERINRHMQQAHATNRSVHANAVYHLPASLQTSARVLVLRVPVHLVLLFAFASLSSYRQCPGCYPCSGAGRVQCTDLGKRRFTLSHLFSSSSWGLACIGRTLPGRF